MSSRSPVSCESSAPTSCIASKAGSSTSIRRSCRPFPGLETHRRALAAGCKVAGASVHFVTTELDHGPIIGQAVVPVRADDSEGSLAERVLAEEHVLYPRAIRWLVDEQLVCRDGVVRHLDGEAQLLADAARRP